MILETGSPERVGFAVDKLGVEYPLPQALLRSNPAEIPGHTEQEVVRHYVRLSQMSYGVDTGMVPLGSCTMKYNPKVELRALELTEGRHPLESEETVQGIMEMLYLMQRWLAEITGTDECSLQPPAGAAGELSGLLIMKKYFDDRNEQRDEVLVADTAHGTNPATAGMLGKKVVYIRSNNEGLLDLELLKKVVSSRTMGLMLTNPNTLGLFEENILEIAKVVHSVGGLLYYDGANLNGILGISRPGDMGFDLVHLNLHKTFGVPHGGGGPGAGAICAKGDLVKYLPYPIVRKEGRRYVWFRPERSIGKIATFWGNVGNVAIAFSYILGLGPEGLREVAKQSVLATNYLIAKLKGLNGLTLMAPHRPRKHEVVFSAAELAKRTGVTANDVAKALLDRGFYAPTIYFPPIVEEALMIEPTETEPIEVLDEFANALTDIVKQAFENPKSLHESPRNTSVGRVDNVKANHPSTITPSLRVKRLREKGLLGPLK
ncbi:MAG: aminomethyl-transferring glycine dehydrogenase subunit GcvPB [Sulfolobus sp.]|nr:aminomethyl-transferring glycine dehydrogenase subunit GcvPB [Sulfolobus sp.]